MTLRQQSAVTRISPRSQPVTPQGQVRRHTTRAHHKHRLLQRCTKLGVGKGLDNEIVGPIPGPRVLPRPVEVNRLLASCLDTGIVQGTSCRAAGRVLGTYFHGVELSCRVDEHVIPGGVTRRECVRPRAIWSPQRTYPSRGGFARSDSSACMAAARSEKEYPDQFRVAFCGATRSHTGEHPPTTNPAVQQRRTPWGGGYQ